MDLPNKFDVIVVGTGMPECIIAAAAARIGKSVLHLDRNSYYGGNWASFSFDKFLEWIEESKKFDDTAMGHSDLESELSAFLKEGENLVLCPVNTKTISNVTVVSNIREVPLPSDLSSPTVDIAQNKDNLVASNETEQNEVDDENDHNEVDDHQENLEPTTPVATAESEEAPTIPETDNTAPDIPMETHMASHEWTFSGLVDNRRKFNIDLAPKIMYSRGPLIELLITSNIARYAEFQCITRVLTYYKDHLEQVPCSRADVFSTRNITVVEKRMLMKFLTFCLKFEEQKEEYEGFEDKPFIQFLKSKKLPANVDHFVTHAIAMVDETCLTTEGLERTQKFLKSIGRYGNSPFLCSCYGSGELPQCFCRLCAVYEGIYHLQRKVEGIIFKDGQCEGVVTMGQRIECEWLVMETSYAPQRFYPSLSSQSLSRAVLVTGASVHSSDKKELTLLRIPFGENIKNSITVIELSSKNFVCPQELYLVYMVCRSIDTAENDLKPAVDVLFQTEAKDDKSSSSADQNETSKPNLLWGVYFNQIDTSTTNVNSQVPPGIFLTSSPDLGLDYDHAVKEAKIICETMFPGEEFLPRAPDPEDIIVENHNPGNESKVENDVTASGDVSSDDIVDNSNSCEIEAVGECDSTCNDKMEP